MAMKEVWTHPKFKALKMRLGLADWEAIGLLESIWGICVQVKSCRDGSILWEPTKIAAYIGWSRDAADMVDALIECGWLDRVAGGVAVHDWQRHSPRWVKGVLKRDAEHHPPPSQVPNSVGHSVRDSVGHSVGTTAGGGRGMGKGRKTEDTDTAGVGGVGEGVVDPMSWVDADWWAQTRRWPDHASLSERGLVANVGTCARRLKSEGLGTALEARLLRSLVLDWPRAGLDPWNALQRILDGLDDPTIKNRVAVLRRRISPYIEMATEVA